jgi:tripartite-type tricarboxylate transporter receptor subunit TctC
VPFPPGGSTDLIGRAVAQAIEAPLGQTMVVVNREGAAGAVGTREVAGDRADGYRLVFPPSSLFTITPQTVQDPDTISLDDLTIITGLTVENIVLIANTDSPYQTLDDLLEAGRSGQTINYGHSGVGIGTYLAQRVFFAQAGINATDVPFDGGGPSVTALVGNQVDIGASQIAESIEQVEAGELRHLGIFTPERNEFLPDVPTMREQGFDIEVDQVRFIAGPPGLPNRPGAYHGRDHYARSLHGQQQHLRHVARDHLWRRRLPDEEDRLRARTAGPGIRLGPYPRDLLPPVIAHLRRRRNRILYPSYLGHPGGPYDPGSLHPPGLPVRQEAEPEESARLIGLGLRYPPSGIYRGWSVRTRGRRKHVCIE